MKFILTLLMVAAFPSSAFSQDKAEIPPVPPEFLQMARPSMGVEEFVLKCLERIRQQQANRDRLLVEDLANEIERYKHQDRTSQLRRLLEQDTNFDGEVSVEEMKMFVYRMLPEDVAKERAEKDGDKGFYASNLEFDLNGDGILTYEEMSRLQDNYKPKEITLLLQYYIDMDGDKDGVITVDEVNIRAREVFASLDKNNNSILDSEEITRNRGSVPPYIRGRGMPVY